MIKTIPLCVLALVFMLVSACDRTPSPTTASAANIVQPSPVMIMTFNVENLFDAADDPDKYDNMFLPLSAKQSDEHKAFLQAAGYNPAIMLEGQDELGRDVGFLSRLPIQGEPQLHADIGNDPNRDGDTRRFRDDCQ